MVKAYLVPEKKPYIINHRTQVTVMTTKNQQIKELIELNDELENYFRNTIIPQLFVDANEILRKITPRALKQFNLTENDIGKPFSGIKDSFRVEVISEDIRQVIKSGEILEKEVETTDARWYQMNILPYIVSETKQTNGVIITFVEITHRIRALKDLEQLINDHETLLDTISHDIKTPLSSLLAAFTIIQHVPPDKADDIQKLLNIQVKSVTKMQSLITELTDTREQEKRYNIEKKVLDFEHIIEDVRLTLNDEIIKSGAVIRIDLQVPQITFPRVKLRSIVYNLVVNSIKYKSPDRTPDILISTKRENDFIVISIKDNGVGIEKSQQEAVFAKYVRLTSDTEGSGIGLYLVKEHVIRAGGRIELYSKPGVGSEFKVYLKAE